jgi:hypothetical protein
MPKQLSVAYEPTLFTRGKLNVSVVRVCDGLDIDERECKPMDCGAKLTRTASDHAYPKTSTRWIDQRQEPHRVTISQ